MLTEQQCRSAKGREKPYKLADEKGLYLYVTPTGYRSWRYKYRFAKKEKRLIFGAYPEVSLKEARDERDDCRQALRAGIDPAAAKRARTAQNEADAGNSFEVLATRWHENMTPTWAPKYAREVIDSLKAEVFPTLGSRPIRSITAPDVLEVLSKVQKRGAIEAAHRVRGRISAVFGTAIAAGLADSDPAAAIAKALRPIKKGNQPALIRLEQARDFLRAVEAIPAHPLTKLASRLLAITAVRPGVIRFTPLQDEFEALDDPDKALWRIPPERMKLRVDEKELDVFELLVPLPPQAIDVITTAQTFLRNRGKYLFPSTRHAHRPMSENALSYYYTRLPGYRSRHVPHGWRSSFSTIMNERAVILERAGDRPIIDLMLAHRQSGVEPIYNRSAYMPRRRQLACEWADLLLEGFEPAVSLLEGPRRS